MSAIDILWRKKVLKEKIIALHIHFVRHMIGENRQSHCPNQHNMFHQHNFHVHRLSENSTCVTDFLSNSWNHVCLVTTNYNYYYLVNAVRMLVDCCCCCCFCCYKICLYFFYRVFFIHSTICNIFKLVQQFVFFRVSYARVIHKKWL